MGNWGYTWMSQEVSKYGLKHTYKWSKLGLEVITPLTEFTNFLGHPSIPYKWSYFTLLITGDVARFVGNS